MKILWASNAPLSGSGYGVQTALVTPRIQALGHDIAIACNSGVEGGVLQWPGAADKMILLYPAGMVRHSVDVVENHATHFGADAIFTHYDAWCYHPQRMKGHELAHPWIPWFPIDCDDVPTLVLNAIRGVRGAAYRITQTRHGQAALAAHNVKSAYVPAAYDPLVYYPRDRAAARASFDIADRFLAVMVAGNTGTKDAPSRKSFPQVFKAWKLFLEREPDALLYVHAFAEGHLNLDELAAEYEIVESVRFAHSYFLHSGLYSPDDMAMIYNAADVLVNPSMGEGFGVPIVEAQACGTPVIVGDWTAMSEVARTGIKISQERAARYQLVGYGGEMFLPQTEAILDALVEATSWTHNRAETSLRVSEYAVDTVFEKHWTPALRDVAELVTPAPLNREQRRRAARQKELAR